MNCLFTETERRPAAVIRGLDLPRAESMLFLSTENIILSGRIQRLIFKNCLPAEKEPFEEIVIY